MNNTEIKNQIGRLDHESRILITDIINAKEKLNFSLDKLNSLDISNVSNDIEYYKDKSNEDLLKRIEDLEVIIEIIKPNIDYVNNILSDARSTAVDHSSRINTLTSSIKHKK